MTRPSDATTPAGGGTAASVAEATAPPETTPVEGRSDRPDAASVRAPALPRLVSLGDDDAPAGFCTPDGVCH